MTNLAASGVQSQNMSTRRFLKVGDVARIMETPESTVYDLARQHRIGGLVKFGRHIRFDREKFERWLDAGGEKAA